VRLRTPAAGAQPVRAEEVRLSRQPNFRTHVKPKLRAFEEFPSRQKAASFSVGKVLDTLKNYHAGHENIIAEIQCPRISEDPSTARRGARHRPGW
jgi:hypothetical protein